MRKVPASEYMKYDKFIKDEPMSVLDKIRAEIEELDGKYVIGDYAVYGESSPKYVRLWEVLQIIDRYRADSEDTK